MKPTFRGPTLREVFPPIVLVAFVWAGVQVLLLIYFRIVLLFPTAPGPSRAEFMAQVLAASSPAGPALASGLLVVNILFVGVIWLRYKSVRPQSRSEKLAAMLTYGGTTILLLFLQWAWLEFLRSGFQQVR